MYKLAKPIRCPNCGEIVQVDTSMILTSYPPQYKWECPRCGRTGTVGSKDDIITFENQTTPATSGYIQKVGEPDLGVGVTTTNATGDGYNTINAVPSIYSPMTECEICGEEFKFDSRSYICPKCREAVVKIRKLFDGQQSIQILSVDSTVQRTDGTTCKTISFPVEVEEKPNRRI